MILVNVWTLGTKFMQNIKLSSPYYLFIILTKVKVASYILQPTLLVGDSERRSFFNFFQLLRNRTLLPKRYVCITIHFRVNRPYVDCGTTYFFDNRVWLCKSWTISSSSSLSGSPNNFGCKKISFFMGRIKYNTLTFV